MTSILTTPVCYPKSRHAPATFWGIPEIHPRQLETITTLMNPQTANQAIYVNGTVVGKLHVMCVLGSLLGGISVIIIPLLTLSSDVLEKIKTENDSFGDIKMLHLEDLYDINRGCRVVLDCLAAIPRGSNSCHFFFLSPQFLVKHQDACDILIVIDAVHRRGVGAVVVDKVYLHVQHGTSLRKFTPFRTYFLPCFWNTR